MSESAVGGFKDKFDFQECISVQLGSVEGDGSGFIVLGGQTDCVAVIRDKICATTYSNGVSSDIGFKLSGGNIFFESVCMDGRGIGVGRSVFLCCWEEVGISTVGELEFG